MAITPSWSEVDVIGGTSDPKSDALSLGAIAEGSLDLRTKHGAYLHCRIGRGGTTALTNGIDLLIRRTLENNAVAHPGPVAQHRSSTVAAAGTTVDTDSNSGQKVLQVASESGFVAGDFILIAGGSAREEWARVSSTGSTILNLDRNLQFTHTAAQADAVRNQADIFPPIWVMGGATYEVLFDYGDDAAGDTARVECKAQVYDSDST